MIAGTPNQTANPYDQFVNPNSVNYGTGAASNLQALQQFLASAQPGSFQAQQTQPLISQQQNVLDYQNAQKAVTGATNNNNYIGGIISNILGGQGGNSNAVTAGDWSALRDALSSNGNPTYSNQFLGQSSTYSNIIDRALQHNGTDPQTGMRLYQIGDLMKKNNVLGTLNNALTGSLNTNQQALLSPQQKMIQGFKLPGIDVQGAEKQFGNYTSGMVNQQLDKDVADAYRQRYVAGQGLGEKLNQSGNFNSGAKQNTEGALNQQTFQGLNRESQGLNSQAANAGLSFDNSLQGAQQAQNAAEQKVKQSATGNEFLTNAGNASNDWQSNFATQLGQNLANNQQAFNQTMANNSQQGDLFSNLANALGTGLSIAAKV